MPTETTFNDCAVCCGDGGIVTQCCEAFPGFPETLYLTIVGAGDCSCMDGTYTLTWNAGILKWETVVNACSGNTTWEFGCVDGASGAAGFHLTLTGVCGLLIEDTSGTATSTDCDPVLFTWDDATVTDCCSSTIDITVSE